MRKIGFILDSFCSRTERELSEMGYHFLPLSVFYDDVQYIDGVSITPIEALQKVQLARKCSTSQPPQALMRQLFKEVSVKYDVIYYFAIADTLSSTYESAMQVAKEFPKLKVFSSTAPGGTIFPLVARIKTIYENGTALEAIDAEINKFFDTVQAFLVPRDFTTLQKSGRIKKSSRYILDKLKIIPILHFSRDGLHIKKIHRIQKKSITKAVEIVKKSSTKIPNFKLIVSHSGDDVILNFTVDKVREIFGFVPQVEVASSIISAHVGYGGIGLMGYYDKFD